MDWKLVPLEPTQEMVRAACKEQPHAINAGFAQAYRTMMANAPSPPVTHERDRDGMKTNELLARVTGAVETLISWAEADTEHQIESGSPGVAREDKARADTLRKAIALLRQCER